MEDVADDSSEPSEPEMTSNANTPQSRRASVEPSLMSAFSRLSFSRSPSIPSSPSPAAAVNTSGPHTPSRPAHPLNSQIILSPQKRDNFSSPSPGPQSQPLPQIRTSLSLLEMLIRLTALQQFQQTSHLAIPDELLTFFLSESATVGAGGDTELRQRVRRDARRRVGFDPYDESPIKRRGEAYLSHPGDSPYSSRASNRDVGTYSPHAIPQRFEDMRFDPHDLDTPDFERRDSLPYIDSSPYANANANPSSYAHAHVHVHVNTNTNRRPSSPSPSSSSSLPPPSIPPSAQPPHAPQTQNRASPSPLLRRATAPTDPSKVRSSDAAARMAHGKLLPHLVEGSQGEHREHGAHGEQGPQRERGSYGERGSRSTSARSPRDVLGKASDNHRSSSSSSGFDSGIGLRGGSDVVS